ncbi:hypothetical protein Egran_06153 [Elaphomyces granulatus]|uniref:Golgi apparatus membrane protein TVP38 n=1 Tax=Elaphomyces granulatus TaxID=519963 RepID=A0A232LPZ0_9EURO|nr:hypothetical protein Egran_06153 [Elaphomyces granulatus]
MLADYQSTARALSLPLSPEEPPSPVFAGIRPPWRQLSGGQRSSLPISVREAAPWRDSAIQQADAARRQLLKRWSKMALWQRVLTVVALVVVIILGLAFLAFTGQLFVWLGPVAEKWENAPLAYVALGLCVFVVSFPPLVGWSTLGTVSGFMFGFWKGWLVYSAASVVGSTCSFIVSRTLLSKFVQRLMEHDTRFAALALTLKYDGLKLLCMIRLCPLPYSLCNGAISTFPTVHPLKYGLATAIITPKLMVAAFIGSRLRILSEKNEEMSAGSKAVNIISIIVSISVGIFTGWYIYQKTLARAKQLEAEEQSRQANHAAGHHPRRESANGHGANKAAVSDEEENIEFHDDLDDDQVDLVVEGDDDSDDTLLAQRSNPKYHDEFTDNDSDVFGDGDGDDVEAYSLKTHIRTR